MDYPGALYYPYPLSELKTGIYMNNKQTINVDKLDLVSKPKPETEQPKPIQISRIAMNVNDLVNDLNRVKLINQQLIDEIKTLRKQLNVTH